MLLASSERLCREEGVCGKRMELLPASAVFTGDTGAGFAGDDDGVRGNERVNGLREDSCFEDDFVGDTREGDGGAFRIEIEDGDLGDADARSRVRVDGAWAVDNGGKSAKGNSGTGVVLG
jgi:hypothetical protein